MDRSKLTSFILVTFMAMLIGAPAQASQTDILYATGDGTTAIGGLFIINPLTGTATTVYSFNNAAIQGGGLAYDNSSGILYATGYDNLSQATLFSINLSTGVANFIGHTGGGHLEFGGLAIDPLTGVMYATGMNGFQNTGLFSVDKNTGTATLIGQAGGQFTALYGLGFSQGGVLFANGFSNYSTSPMSDLLTVNLATGVATDIGPHGVPLVGRQLAYSGLAFDANGSLLSLGSITGATGGLYSVNSATGAATLIGPTGLPFGVDGGLAFVPAPGVTPEPGTFGLFGAGLGLVLLISRFRRSKLSALRAA